MSKDKDRKAYQRANEDWIDKKNSPFKASSIHSTQTDAEKAAREMLKKSGGDELTTKGINGKIRSKDSVSLPWWEKISGTYENNDAFNEAMELGRQYRQSLSKNLIEQE